MVLIGEKVGEAPPPATGSQAEEEEENGDDDDCNEKEAQKSARESERPSDKQEVCV